MAVMAVKVPKVTRVAQRRLDPRELRVSMERMALKGTLESRDLLAKRGSAERVEQVESLGLLVRCLIRTGKNVHGER